LDSGEGCGVVVAAGVSEVGEFADEPAEDDGLGVEASGVEGLADGIVEGTGVATTALPVPTNTLRFSGLYRLRCKYFSDISLPLMNVFL